MGRKTSKQTKIIPGLDPAEPDYENTDVAVHLDKTDAVFVDIIHSDGSEFDYMSGRL